MCTECNQTLIQFFSPDGSDYYNVSQIITFTSGSSMGDTQCVEISIIDDNNVECDDVFNVSLTTTLSTVSIPVEHETASVTIVSDSTDGEIMFSVVWMNTIAIQYLAHFYYPVSPSNKHSTEEHNTLLRRLLHFYRI